MKMVLMLMTMKMANGEDDGDDGTKMMLRTVMMAMEVDDGDA